MSILTLLVIVVSILVLLKVGSLLFDPPTWKHLTLAELEREMTRVANEWARSIDADEHTEKMPQSIDR